MEHMQNADVVPTPGGYKVEVGSHTLIVPTKTAETLYSHWVTHGFEGENSLTAAANIPDSIWLSANDRHNRFAVADRVKRLREMGSWVALAHKLPRSRGRGRWHLSAHIQYPTRGKADPTNANPTVKALLDGFVDYGVFPDDNYKYVVGPDFRRAPGVCARGTHVVTLVATPITETS